MIKMEKELQQKKQELKDLIEMLPEDRYIEQWLKSDYKGKDMYSDTILLMEKSPFCFVGLIYFQSSL